MDIDLIPSRFVPSSAEVVDVSANNKPIADRFLRASCYILRLHMWERSSSLVEQAKVSQR